MMAMEKRKADFLERVRVCGADCHEMFRIVPVSEIKYKQRIMEISRLNRIEDAVADFKEGKFVIVVDDEDRENEGDLIIAAEKITEIGRASCRERV